MQTLTTNLKLDIEYDKSKNTIYIRDEVKGHDLDKIKCELALLGFGRCNLVIGKNFDGLSEEEKKRIRLEKELQNDWKS